MTITTTKKPARTTPKLITQLYHSTPIDVAGWITAYPSPIKRSAQVEQLSVDERRALCDRLDAPELALLLASLEPESAVKPLLSTPHSKLPEVLSTLSQYELADILREMTPGQRGHVLLSADEVLRDSLYELLKWKGESAGGNMTPSFIVLPEDMSVEDAIVRLREDARDVEAATYVYLVDGDGLLSGAASLRGIITADKDTRLSELSQPSLQQVTPQTDREVAAQVLTEHDLTALPVVEEGTLIGVITADRAADIMQDETTEDFRRMSSSSGTKVLSLKSASVWVLYRSRVVWLVVLVFGNIFSGAGIAHYEDLIESVVALVFFLPLLIDSGGNAGSQAATLMVRGLATGDVELKDWFKGLGKEFLVASLLGLSMAVAVSIIGVVRGGPEIAVVVALTMVIVVIIGSVIGMSLPFLLSKLGLDPANASAPLITSICDGVGVLIYFFIASQFLL